MHQRDSLSALYIKYNGSTELIAAYGLAGLAFSFLLRLFVVY